MTTEITRRQALRLMVLSSLSGLATACSRDAAPAPTIVPAQPTRRPPTPTATRAAPTPPAATSTPVVTAVNATAMPEPLAPTMIDDMTRAATDFLAALDEGQRAKVGYAFDDAERVRWHWTTPRNFPRNGLPLREMGQDQRDRAMALLQVSVSDDGFQKALDIMSLQNDLGNDPELYYVTVFGAPGDAKWGWRFEGHHLSRHYTIAGDRLAVTPFFLGSWPTVSSTGLKAMEREEWAARELITSLEGDQRQTALFQERTLTRHLTQNQPYVAPLDPIGVAVSDLNADRQALVQEIVQTYLGTLPIEWAEAHRTRLQTAGIENIRFGWAGALESRRPHYYRLQGPTFLLEFDNSRNGGTHIHSVWRDFAEDFGQHLA